MIKLVIMLLSLLAPSMSFEKLLPLYKTRIESLSKLIKTRECADIVTDSVNTYVKGLLTETYLPFENVLLASQCQLDVASFPPLVSNHYY